MGLLEDGTQHITPGRHVLAPAKEEATV